MILRYFYDDKLAQASYLVGCAATGEALVIDPMRDIAPYVSAAQRQGLKITHVTETHIHACLLYTSIIKDRLRSPVRSKQKRKKTACYRKTALFRTVD